MNVVFRKILDMSARFLTWYATLGFDKYTPKKGNDDGKKTN